MKDGRMSSRVTIELFGPDGQAKTAAPACCGCCSDNECGDCPRKDEDNEE